MKLPVEIINEFEKTAESLNGFGTVRIILTLHDNRPHFVLSCEKSIVPSKSSSGAVRVKND